MAGKKGLGSGLEALISVNLDTDVSRETIVNININNIEPNREQPRTRFDDDAIEELASSIKQHGIFQPLLVREDGKGRYKIIAGERRWRAARIAGLNELPVIVKDYAPDTEFIIALLENIQREGLNSIEEAQAYKRLIEEYKFKQDEVAEKVSKSRVAITNSLRLLKLDERVQEMVTEDMITGGHARALLSIENKDEQYKIAQKVFDEKLSVREVEKLVRKIANSDKKKPVKKTEKTEVLYKNYVEKMRMALGSKVDVNAGKNGKGKIIIDFTSNDEFERIFDIIVENLGK